ncbi:MAG: DUF2281 domain-containing protein [Cyclobacteriaceae bacterium]|jgi:hypothetical protein
MSAVELQRQIESLPASLQKKVEEFIASLKANLTYEKKTKAKLEGSLQGKVWMSEDFDAPLEDFKDYM